MSKHAGILLASGDIEYPTPFDERNLRIQSYREIFVVDVQKGPGLN